MMHFKLNTILLHSLFLGVLLLPWQGVLALTCTACDPSACPTSDCVGGVVWDPCQCCKICAQQALQPCGGMYAIYGQCDMNLTCIIQPNHGDLLTGNEPGICKPTDALTSWDKCQESAYDGCNVEEDKCTCGRLTACSNPFQFQSAAKCNLYLSFTKSQDGCEEVICDVQQSPHCPEDSVLIEGYTPTGTCCPLPSRCECHPQRCSYNLCPPNSERVLVRRGNDQPGTCCDLYSCQSQNECAGVRCATDYTQISVSCPADSTLISDSSKRSCCPGKSACQCHFDRCSVPKCPHGKSAQVTYRGDGKPGSCCDVYSCTKENQFVGCSVNGTRFEHGAAYHHESCSICECKNGLSHCEPRICPSLSCTSLVKDPAACCPRCLEDGDGNNPPYFPYPMCKSSDGSSIYEVGETWSPDRCTHCKCEADGQTRCTAAFCQEPPEITVTAPSCPSLVNCSLSDSDCPFGYKHDEQQCRLCDCNPSVTGCSTQAHCTVDCARGYLTDESGCNLCKCRQRQCKDLTNCMKQCPYGYKINKKGCDRCKCRRCPSMDMCTKICSNGLDFNKYGCQICKCRDLSKAVDFINARSCIDPFTSRRYDDGETWSSNCYICVCRGGDVMCDVMKCPVPKCNKPRIKDSDCCPTCPGETKLSGPLVPQSLSCQQFNEGNWYAEGETWTYDNCTSCTCHSGHVMCTSPKCLPTPCVSPFYEPGNCCPQCPDNEVDVDYSVHSTCVDDTGKVYKNGMVYQRDACTSCVCLKGISKCFSKQCPLIHGCDNPVLKRGQCCPKCLGKTKPSGNCNAGNTIRNNEEHWNMTADACATCVCRHGHVECSNTICKPIPVQCRRLYKRPGTCCDECVEVEAKTPPGDGNGSPTSATYEWMPIVLAVCITCLAIGVVCAVVFLLKKKRSLNKQKYTPGLPTLTTSSDPNQMMAASGLRTGSVGTARTLIVSTSSEDERTSSGMDH
ncbi:cysteine-rich motor neuron 1 protein-like [Clavelina lepadiformis]|uniref:cysteine-rich motor neuron 1 protein-like n=1 Tax=Clavelina lepadiformis TaxID=159417 RepID=UPI004041821E